MNFFKYLESRFVSSQIAINNKAVASATSGVAVNKSFRAWMWLSLQLMTIIHFLLLPFHYLGVVLHMVAPPRSAAQQMQELQDEQKAKAEIAAKVQADLMKGAMADRAETGLDSLPRRGSA